MDAWLHPYIDTVARIVGYLILIGAGAVFASTLIVASLRLAGWLLLWLVEDLNDWLRADRDLPEDREWTDSEVRETQP